MITFPRYFNPGCLVNFFTTQRVPLGSIFTSGLTYVGEEHRVVFSLSRTMDSTPDSGEIRVYGLSDITRTAISSYWSATGRLLVSISAGYEALMMPLVEFADVRETNTLSREGQDYVTSFVFDDGGDAFADVRLPLQPGAMLSAAQMIDVAIAALAQAPLIDPTLGPITLVKHPSVLTALATPFAQIPFRQTKINAVSDLLDEAARLCSANWFIRNGLLYFSQRNLPTDPVAYVFPRTHWLGEASENGKGVVSVSLVLDPLATPGNLCSLIGRVTPWALETFRIEAGTYSMDTDQGTAAMDLTLRRLA